MKRKLKLKSNVLRSRRNLREFTFNYGNAKSTNNITPLYVVSGSNKTN